MPGSPLEKWPRLASRLLFEHHRLRIFLDTLQLPTGNTIDWLRFGKLPDFVSLLCLNEQNEVLIARQYCPPPDLILPELPGGGIDHDESPAMAARRELVEEAGLYPHTLHYLGSFYVNRRRSDLQGHMFLAQDLEPRPAAPEEAEIMSLHWYSIPQMEVLIRNGELNTVSLLAAWSLFRARFPQYFESSQQSS